MWWEFKVVSPVLRENRSWQVNDIEESHPGPVLDESYTNSDHRNANDAAN